jgi:hypothetical protein
LRKRIPRFDFQVRSRDRRKKRSIPNIRGTRRIVILGSGKLMEGIGRVMRKRRLASELASRRRVLDIVERKRTLRSRMKINERSVREFKILRRETNSQNE